MNSEQGLNFYLWRYKYLNNSTTTSQKSILSVSLTTESSGSAPSKKAKEDKRVSLKFQISLEKGKLQLEEIQLYRESLLQHKTKQIQKQVQIGKQVKLSILTIQSLRLLEKMIPRGMEFYTSFTILSFIFQNRLNVNF